MERLTGVEGATGLFSVVDGQVVLTIADDASFKGNVDMDV